MLITKEKLMRIFEEGYKAAQIFHEYQGSRENPYCLAFETTQHQTFKKGFKLWESQFPTCVKIREKLKSYSIAVEEKPQTASSKQGLETPTRLITMVDNLLSRCLSGT